MSFADEYALLEAFLHADPDYARLDAECSRLEKIVNEKDQSGHEATGDYDKWNSCEEAMDSAVFESPNNASSDLHCEHLRSGQMFFQRLKREAMISAGKAFSHWWEATDQLCVATSDRQTRRSALVDTWNEIKAVKKSVEAAQ